ncbi:MAG: two component regulator propeller domain protein [Bacteroidetes bacterium]|uniref:type IX secretion system anionic LPS delivery protein PorZ n=1 Tax=Chitinophaga sp. LS1 TaxID=3051176 RepID=UPI001DAD9754|nr:two-component regulator propeller domain-containing protein [Chitinophaga sp. LS1]MBP1650092.1 two component regulator propeller domain protein [Bacteroidota bacterium]WPV68418.1 two-component regulator propeller domain-containing protein [Chitinophaga sp. LS1]
MYRFLLSLYLLCLGPLLLSAQTLIGQWQSWLPSLPAISVAMQGDKVYYATSSGLFSLTTGAEQDITRYSKVNGLHDIGISTICSNENGVLIAYRNSNLDLLSGSNSYNLPDLQRKQTAEDKTIYRIYAGGTNTYLCTGLGVVVVNTTVPEIAATYAIGSVYGFTMLNNQLYAATSAGVKTAPLTGSNPSDYRNWSMVGQLTDTVDNIVSYNGQLICQQHQSLYILNNGAWIPYYSGATNIAVQGDYLTVSNDTSIVYIGKDGNAGTPIQNALLKAIRQTTGNNQYTWVADSLYGLLQYDGQEFSAISLNGPASILTGQLLFYNNTLYAPAGGVSDSWVANNNAGVYYTYNSSGEWHQYTDNLHDIITMAPDPTGDGMYAGSFGGGLIHIAADGTRTYALQGQKISGLTNDASGNLWIAVYGATYNLVCKKPDGTYLTFRSTYAQSGNAISQLVADEAGQIWIVSPQSNGLFVYNTLTNEWKQFRQGSGQGNLPSNDVYCIAKDKNGSLWVGTGTGIGVIGCSTCDAVWPIIQQDNFAGYLFQDEQVTAIAVDGANRKWVGTHNGVWLVSEDGTSIEENFTASNSPLPGNQIYSITIHPTTGEVYFATDQGLMSYRGTATEGKTMSKDSVLVFPNPVPHDYSGNIAINGLTENTLVKITDINGRVVYQTRSKGGLALWSGLDYTGHRPQTGVYLVFASSATTGEHLVTKIVFIN